MEKLLREETRSGRFSVVPEVSQASDVEVSIITVGTPLTPDLRPDLTHLQDALQDLSRSPLQDKLIVLRSTVPPGTTRGMVEKILRKRGKSSIWPTARREFWRERR